jgi:hypothetical protein
LTVNGGPYTDQEGDVYYLFDMVVFVPSASEIDITGWFITADLAGGVTAAGTAVLTSGSVTSVTITLAGGPYAIPPEVTFAAPTSGVTATGHAVLTSGGVSSVVVDNPGSGYGSTAPAVTFTPPQTLQGGGNFQTPVPWVLGTALPLTCSCYAGSSLPPAAG